MVSDALFYNAAQAVLTPEITATKKIYPVYGLKIVFSQNFTDLLHGLLSLGSLIVVQHKNCLF